MVCTCGVGGCGTSTKCGCQSAGIACTSACHQGQHHRCCNRNFWLTARSHLNIVVGRGKTMLLDHTVFVSISVLFGAVAVWLAWQGWIQATTIACAHVRHLPRIIVLVTALYVVYWRACEMKELQHRRTHQSQITFYNSQRYTTESEIDNNFICIGVFLLVILVLQEYYSCPHWTAKFFQQSDSCLIPSIASSFESGMEAPPLVHCPISRADEKSVNVSRLLGSSSNRGAYHIVDGPEGSGKTTLLKDACFRAGVGVVYVAVRHPTVFPADLAAVLNVPQMGQQADVYAGTNHVLSALGRATETISRRLGQPGVLVIDGVEKLERVDREVVESLQDFSARQAELNTLTVIFASSGDRAAVSQLGEFLHIGDVSKNQSLEYLKCRGVYAKDSQESIVNNTAGRIALLHKAALDIERGGVDSRTMVLHIRIITELDRLGISSFPENGTSDSSAVWRGAHTLLRYGEMPTKTFQGLFSSDLHGTRVISSFLFQQRFSDLAGGEGLVLSFQSPLIADFFRLRLDASDVVFQDSDAATI